MRIIRVSGCHDCPPDNKLMVLDEYLGCKKIAIGERGGFYLNIEKYMESKTLPDNCPLEEGNEAKYQELLYHVGQKFPDESRHETALRYIKEAEKPTGEMGECNLKTSMEDKK